MYKYPQSIPSSLSPQWMMLRYVKVLQVLVGHFLQRSSYIDFLQRVAVEDYQFVAEQLQVQQNHAAIFLQALELEARDKLYDCLLISSSRALITNLIASSEFSGASKIP